MADLGRLDSTYGIISSGMDISPPASNTQIIAAPVTVGAYHTLHSLVYSSDQVGSIKIVDNLAGSRVDLIRTKWFGAYGGVALTDLFKKARPGASIEITVTGGGTASVDFTYHTKGEAK